MKYRRLTKEQFEIFHEKFATFLATQKIDSEYWKKIVETNSKLTEELLDLFSDIIWEGALENANYLEHYSPKHLKVFSFQTNSVDLISVKVSDKINIDFNRQDSVKLLFENIMSNEIEVFKGGKKFDPENRNAEMFQLIEEGCIISDGNLFKALNNFINS